MAMAPRLNDPLIQREIIAFIIDRRSRQLSENTITYYKTELNLFTAYLAKHYRQVKAIPQITAQHIRQYLMDLGHTRNEGGVHSAYRAIKAFYNWYIVEIDDPACINPMGKIQAPRVSKDPLPGITMEQVQKLLDTCSRSVIGKRDQAILLTLVDTGLRRAEMAALNYGDIDLKTGAVLVRNGKGGKPRTVYMGNRARRDLIRYLRHRGELLPASPLWVTRTGERLTMSGFRQIIRRRAARAGIKEPGLHDFRRAFAIQSLRNGMDIFSLMRLMGHSSPEVLKRYLYLLQDDLQLAHAKASPADNL